MADNTDPLLRILRAARTWGRPPTVVLGRKIRTAYEHTAAGIICASTTDDWTQADTELMLALEDYEAGLCPGGPHPLAETSKVEHDGAYVPDPPTQCHLCDAQALNAEVVAKNAERTGERTAGLLFSFSLDSERVALNKEPVPPLPPEFDS